MHRTIGGTKRHQHYITWTNDEHYHKANCDNPIGKLVKLPQTTYTTPKIMSINNDRTYTDASSPRGRRGGRTPRGRNMGQGFHFGLNA
jgi:hypothetical protein